MRRPSVFSKYVDCRSAESHPLSRAFAATQWSMVYQTLHWSLKDSGYRKRLQILSEVSNTQVHHIDMDSQEAPQTVEVSQQQYTNMNVDVLVIWRHTDGAENRKQNRSKSHVRVEGNIVESQRHVSTIRGVQESVLRQGERCERSEQSTVKGAQWKDRCRGSRRCS